MSNNYKKMNRSCVRIFWSSCLFRFNFIMKIQIQKMKRYVLTVLRLLEAVFLGKRRSVLSNKMSSTEYDVKVLIILIWTLYNPGSNVT